MKVVEAREALLKMNIAVYPNMEKKAYNRFWDKMWNIANPWHLQEEMPWEEAKDKWDKPW